MVKVSPYRTFLFIEATFGLFVGLVVPIATVYRLQAAGLNPLELVLVGTVLEGATLVFQVPTGLLADAVSRRLTIIAGMFVLGVAYLFEGSFPVFFTIAAAQVVRALGYALVAGAEEAWISGELGEEGIARVFVRGTQVSLAGTLAGSVLSGFLASVRLNLPFLVAGGLFLVLGAVLVVVMQETGFRPGEGETAEAVEAPWKSIAATARSSWRVVRLQPLVVTIFGIAIFWGMSSEGFDRLWAAHLLANFRLPALGAFRPVVWFSVIAVVASLLSLGATEVVNRLLAEEERSRVPRLLAVFTVGLLLAVATFALSGSFALALAAYWVAATIRATYTPIYNAWLVQYVPSRVRATVLSASVQFDSLGQLGGGPVIGLVGTLASVRAAIVTAAAMLGPVLALLALSFRQMANIRVAGNPAAEVDP